MANYSPIYLDRSPSLSSNSSDNSSAAGLPITPSMNSNSTFSSPLIHNHKDLESDSYSNNVNQQISSKGSIGNLAAYSSRRTFDSSKETTPTAARPTPSAWSSGHRTGAGSASFDSTRAQFGATSNAGRSPSLRTGLLNKEENNAPGLVGGEKVSAWRTSSSPSILNRTNSITTSPTKVSSASTSTFMRPPSTSIDMSRTSSAPIPSTSSPSSSFTSNYQNTSPTRANSHSSYQPQPTAHSPLPPTSARALSSSIFATKDSNGFTETVGSGLQRSGSFARGHRRAMTLPQLGGLGLPVPPSESEVVGLPGRTRLSRPVEIQSPFAPSAVFSSAHGLNLTAAGNNPSPTLSNNSSPLSTPRSFLPSQTVRAIDRQRKDLVAYEYLCHVAETKEWMKSNIQTKMDQIWEQPIGAFEESLRNGYALAHLARSLGGPECAGPIFNHEKLQYRHTDNIDIFFRFVGLVGLPEIFRFETLDLYNAKNLPKVIYCLHALSYLLARRGLALKMENLVGQIDFTDDEVNATQKGLDSSGVRMPNFNGIGKALAKTIPEEVEEPEETEQQRQERELAEARPSIISLQAHCRGLLARRNAIELERSQHEAAVKEAARMMIGFQATVRGVLVRREFFDRINQLDRHERSIILFQAAARGALARSRHNDRMRDLDDAEEDVVSFQAVARGFLTRKKLLGRIRALGDSEASIIKIQATVRGNLARAAYASKVKDLRRVDVVRSVGGFQSLARAALVRRRVEVQKQELGFVEPDVVGIQAQIRGYLGRNAFLDWKDYMDNSEDRITRLQASIRGFIARKKYYDLRQHFLDNLSKVVRLQAAIRSRKQGSQYRQLKMGKNVPVGTIKNFVRLLDDSDFDYREELLVEQMRKELVRSIRETQGLEDDVKDLDTKIALLVRNKITHEVARAQRLAGGGGLAPIRRNSLLAAAKDPFATNALDRQTQRKLELYQQLFGHLQSNPAYLARLFANTGRIGMSEKVQKAVESTTFVIFGYAQNQREEFLLLKLFQRSIEEEVVFLPDIPTFARANFAFIRLLVQYGRGASQRKYLKDLLAPQIHAIMSRTGLELGSDPLTIYRAEIAKEETRTGVVSSRPLDVSYLQAIRDKDTATLFISNLKALRAATDGVLEAMYASTSKMPFGVRYVAREVYRSLKTKFPNEPEEDVIRVVGHLVYYRFIQPAAVAPETVDIIESVVPPVQRRNLAEVCKLLNQISVGRLFDQEQPYLTPLNEFIASSAARFAQWIHDVINVEDAESYFGTDQYKDAADLRSPVIYIAPNDVYATHTVIAENIDVLIPEPNDPLRAIITELGGAPSQTSSDLNRARAEEVALTLSTRIRTQDDPNASSKILFNEAKRRILAVLKIHHGADLEEVLTQGVTPEDEDAWRRLVDDEENEERRLAESRGRSYLPPANNLRGLSFRALKAEALRDIIALRKAGLVTRDDRYQALLDAIALDIRQKHQRRIQRRNELTTMTTTLDTLRMKKRYLSDQVKSYHSYIDQTMMSIQKKTKKRLVLPWSMQAIHERQLQKSGKTYQFGSFKYTAQVLYDRGILLSIDQYSPKQFDKIALSISSDEVGCFEVEASYMGIAVTTVELKLEELLEMQFEGRSTISIGGVAKANLNLLIHLVNRKFYR